MAMHAMFYDKIDRYSETMSMSNNNSKLNNIHSTTTWLYNLQKQNVGIVIALLVIEVMAATWYALSYIPFGRKVVIMFLRRTICKPCFIVYDSVKGSKSTGGGSSTGKEGGLAAQV